MRKQVRYVGLILVIILGGCKDSQEPGVSGRDQQQKSTGRIADSADLSPQSTVAAQPKLDGTILAYEVVDRDTYDAPIKTQIRLHAVVSGTITEIGLRQLIEKLYDEANATRGFKYHGGKPTHVAIYLYTSRDHFKSGMGQWIAMLSKIGEGSRIDTQIRKELIAQLGAEPEVKHGLAESTRKEIFTAIVMAQDRADADAQRMYPLPDPSKPGYSQVKAREQIEKRVQMYNTLREKYELEVAERYGMAQRQLRDISSEGSTKNWPIPPMP